MKEANKTILKKPTHKVLKDRTLTCNRFKGQSFCDEVVEYGYYYDEVLRKRTFGVTGKKNIRAEINSHKCETDMTYIKNELLKNGTDVIDESLMADCTMISNDLLINLSKSEQAKLSFSMLPKFVRERYGNDMYRFASEFKSSDFDFVVDHKKVEAKKEVENNENKE